MRKLATIQRIASIEPIAGADSIELARVLGWQCVVKKGEFNPGDLCVYFEIDSVLPPRPEFEFLAPRKYRVRTIKLRGVISQGLAMPPGNFPELPCPREGDDVTEKLGVTKHGVRSYSKHGNRTGAKVSIWKRAWNWILVKLGKRDPGSGTFPSFIPKTDETRIQSMPAFLDKHAGEHFYATEKLDGCSVTVWVKDGKFGCASRNTVIDPNREYSDLRKHFMPVLTKLGVPEAMKLLGRNIALQGELVGPGIQGNKYGLSHHQLYLFNVYDIDAGKYEGASMVSGVAGTLGINMVPVLGSFELSGSVDDLVTASRGKSVLNKKVNREGIVVRRFVDSFDPNFGRCSFKVINPDFLLKYEEDDTGDDLEDAAE